MKKRQTDKSETGSGHGWIWLMAALLVTLGFSIALVQLALQPVDELKGNYSGGQNWQAKRDALRDARLEQLSFTESDLNLWLQSEVEKLRKATDRHSVLGGAQLHSASIKLEGDMWYLGLSFAWESNVYLQKKNLIYMASGHLLTWEGEPRIQVEKTQIGKAPLGKVPLIGTLLLRYFTRPLLKKDSVMALRESLLQYSGIEVKDGLLNVSRED